MNVVILAGNVGKDAEVRQTQSGKDFLRFRLAVNERWVDASGAKQEKVNWFNCVVWGERATKLAPHVTQGLKLGVRGKLEVREVEKDGVKATYTDVVVDEVEFLSPKKDETETRSTESRGRPASAPQPASNGAKGSKKSAPVADDDSIPY